MDKELMTELSKAEVERQIIKDELNFEMKSFADELMSGTGEQMKALSGIPNKIIKKSLWARLRQWAKRVTN